MSTGIDDSPTRVFSTPKGGLFGGPFDPSGLDGARAADWYERAALAGSAEAQRKLGLLLAKGGGGLPADPAKAKTWLQQAAAQNDADAKKALDALPK
jgi:TPR repeat protein